MAQGQYDRAFINSLNPRCDAAFSRLPIAIDQPDGNTIN
jgi:hypothetical protein